MARYITNLTGLPFGEPTMTQWYQLYRESLALEDLSLFSRREDRGIYTIGGGNITYNNVTNVLSWDSPIQIIHPFTKEITEVMAGGKSDVLFDTYIYVNLKRLLKGNGRTLTMDDVIVSKRLPNSDLFFVLFYITPLGSVITDIDNSIPVSSVEPTRFIVFDELKSGDFPNNPIEMRNNNNISTVRISDLSGALNNKKVFLDFITDHDFISSDFKLNFIYSVEAITRDIYFDLDVYKNSLGSTNVATNILSVNNIHFTPASINDLILYLDSNLISLTPDSFFSIEINFLNDDGVLHLGNATNIDLFSFYLSSN